MRGRESINKKNHIKEQTRENIVMVDNDNTNLILREILKQLKVTGKDAIVGSTIKVKNAVKGAFISDRLQELPNYEDSKKLSKEEFLRIERMRSEGVKNKSVSGRLGNFGRWAEERTESFAGYADNPYQQHFTHGIVKGISGGVKLIGGNISKKYGANFDERIEHKEKERITYDNKTDNKTIKHNDNFILDDATKKTISSIDTGVKEIAKSVKSIDNLLIENSLDKLEKERETNQNNSDKNPQVKKELDKITDNSSNLGTSIKDLISKVIPLSTAFKTVTMGALRAASVLSLQTLGVGAAAYAGYKVGGLINKGYSKASEALGGSGSLGSDIYSGVQATKSGYAGAVDFTSRGIEAGVQGAKAGYASAVDTTSRGIEAGVSGISETLKENYGASETISNVIKKASDLVGVDFGSMMAFAKQESNFNPNAKANGSTATGLFQFIKSTWADMVGKYGKQYGIEIEDIKDPMANATMGALYIRDNSNALKKRGIEVNGTTLYAAHLLGPDGASKLLSADKKSDASKILPRAAGSNKAIFYKKNGEAKTVEEVVQTLFQKVGKNVDSFAAAVTKKTAAANGGMSASVNSAAPTKIKSTAESVGASKMTTLSNTLAVATNGSNTITASGPTISPNKPNNSTTKTNAPVAIPSVTRNDSPLKKLQTMEMHSRII